MDDIKLTNGKKILIRSKVDFERNTKVWAKRGYWPLEEKKEIKKATSKDNTAKVVQLKPKRKKNVRKTKKKS